MTIKYKHDNLTNSFSWGLIKIFTLIEYITTTFKADKMYLRQ